jgi:transcriptional regulator NrdR family protein
VIAWQEEQSRKCPGCRHPIDEVWVFDPKEQREQEAKASAHLRKCVVCAARDRTVEKHTSNERYDAHGIHVIGNFEGGDD